MTVRAPLVVLEGLDGCGKSTVARLLAERTGARLLRTPSQELAAVRAVVDAALDVDPLSRALFYAASVLAASDQARRSLASGRTVVMDRYWLSTLAYAEASGVRLRLPDVERRLVPATVTVFLQAPSAVRRARMAGRDLSPHDRLSLEPGPARVLEAAYLARAGHPLAGCFLILDAQTETPEALADRVLARLDACGRLPAQEAA